MANVHTCIHDVVSIDALRSRPNEHCGYDRSLLITCADGTRYTVVLFSSRRLQVTDHQQHELDERQQFIRGEA